MADHMRARQFEPLHELRKLCGLARNIRIAGSWAAMPVAHTTPGEHAMFFHDDRRTRQRFETVGENPAMDEHHGIAGAHQAVLEGHVLKYCAFPRLRIRRTRGHQQCEHGQDRSAPAFHCGSGGNRCAPRIGRFSSPTDCPRSSRSGSESPGRRATTRIRAPPPRSCRRSASAASSKSSPTSDPRQPPAASPS